MFKYLLKRPRALFTWLILMALTPALCIANVPAITPATHWHINVTTLKHNVLTFNNISKASMFLIVMPAVNTYRSNGNLGKQATVITGYSGLVMGGVSVNSGVQLNTTYELNSINDAAALGINAAYDTTNTTLVFYHINEFFRTAPSGRLYLRLVSQATTLTAMCTASASHGAWDLLNDPLCKGQIRQLSVALNPVTGYTPTIANGINSDSIALTGGVYSGAAVQAQNLANIMFGKHMPVRVFVEARNFGGSSAALLDATGSACNDVQLVMLNDNDVAISNALYANHAAMGTVLGLRANLSVQQKMSYTAVGNIQNAALGAFVNPGLSSGALLSTYTTGYTLNGTHTNGDDDIILGKGFIAPRVIPMYAGVFLNDDITATAATDDYYAGPYGLVVNESNRLMYVTMVPNLNEDVNIDPTTGYLDINLIKNWEQQLNLAGQLNLSNYVATGTDGLPAIKYLIDPNQNVLANSTIDVQIQITPKGFAGTINEYIGLNNPYQNN